MASKIEVDEIFNAGGDNDTGIDLATNDVVKVKTANTERMRVDSGGDVGIGVSPETDHYGAYVNVNFGVSGLVGSNASGTNTTFLTNNAYLNTGPNWIYKETDEATKYNQSGGKHIWEGAASGSAGGTISFTERMTLDASGNLLVGRTDNPSGVSSCIYGLGNYGITTGSGANVYINSEGLFFRSTSSKRYKNAIQDATHGLTELLTLRPVTFKNNEDGDKVYGGLIAEEVHEAGLTEFVQYNDDNQPDSLDYGNMVSLCIKTIQELSAKNDALEARIKKLEDG